MNKIVHTGRFIILGILFSFLGKMAFGLESSFVPIDWQKINLEENIQTKISSLIAPIVGKTDSAIIVDIKINPSNTTDIENEGAPAAPKSSAVRFNDAKNSINEGRDDYILLDKLGVEAPNYQAETKPVSQQVIVQNNVRSQGALLSKFDLFKYIKEISITVILDQSLSEQKKSAAKKILELYPLQFGETKAKLDIKFMPLNIVDKIQVEKKVAAPLEIIAPFSNSIGIMLSVLIFSALSFILFKKYIKLQERQIEALNTSAKAKPEQEREERNKPLEKTNEMLTNTVNTVAAANAAHQTSSSMSGIERFKNFMLTNPEQTKLLLKRWLKLKTESTKLSLAAIPSKLSTKELSTLFEFVSLDERKEWKKIIDKTLTSNEQIIADQFISSQLVEEMLSPQNLNGDAATLLSELSPTEAAELATSDTKLGILFMNVMDGKFIAAMMALMPEEKTKALILESTKCDFSQIAGLLSYASGKLKLKKPVIKKAPFVDQIMELIPVATPLIEEGLFNAIAETGDFQLLKEVATEYFPYSIFPKLPSSVIKTIVDYYPKQKRFEYIATLEGQELTQFIEAIAESGSKSRDLLDLDLKTLEKNEILRRRILKNRSNIQKSFIDFTRQVMKKIPDLQEKSNEVLLAWVDEKKEALSGPEIKINQAA